MKSEVKLVAFGLIYVWYGMVWYHKLVVFIVNKSYKKTGDEKNYNYKKSIICKEYSTVCF